MIVTVTATVTVTVTATVTVTVVNGVQAVPVGLFLKAATAKRENANYLSFCSCPQ